jgi:hypothetical protein
MLVPLEDVLRTRETTWPEKAIIAELTDQDGFHANQMLASAAPVPEPADKPSAKGRSGKAARK